MKIYKQNETPEFEIIRVAGRRRMMAHASTIL